LSQIGGLALLLSNFKHFLIRKTAIIPITYSIFYFWSSIIFIYFLFFSFLFKKWCSKPLKAVLHIVVLLLCSCTLFAYLILIAECIGSLVEVMVRKIHGSVFCNFLLITWSQMFMKNELLRIYMTVIHPKLLFIMAKIHPNKYIQKYWIPWSINYVLIVVNCLGIHTDGSDRECWWTSKVRLTYHSSRGLQLRQFQQRCAEVS